MEKQIPFGQKNENDNVKEKLNCKFESGWIGSWLEYFIFLLFFYKKPIPEYKIVH